MTCQSGSLAREMNGQHQKKSDMKKCTIIGNVGRVPTTRTNAKGVEFFEMSVAVNGKENQCTWFSVILRNSLAKIIPYLTRGKNVYVEGEFSVDVYKGEASITIYADELQLLGNKTIDNDLDVVDRKPLIL